MLQEVYFSGGNSERLSSLRHRKRYQVPESPLLQVCAEIVLLLGGVLELDAFTARQL
jgi:hypothetical protein